jgi:coatomer subunit beta'
MDIQRKFSARSDRVKSVDFHPTEPWILASLYNGNVYIWNYKTQNLVKSFEVSDLPVRTAKFIARKQWVICGADDMVVRVYNYNTMEKVAEFEAHQDYIRCLAVHPTQSFVISSSDDMLIKLWDWDKSWQCVQVFEGHTHYVMQLSFNPKDPNTFASASLDRTIKVWGLGSPVAHFTLEGHEKGVNAIEYFTGGDKPYLISGADDKLLKVWDYQNKTCVQTLEGHTHNVSVACFHPTLPLIISGSEDGTVRLWNSNTYRLEKTLNYGMERIWALGYLKGSNKLVLGYDEGCVMIKLGSEEPAVSMDPTGKVVWAKHNEIQAANVKVASESEVVDGERLALPTKDMGSVEIYPQFLKHNPNGRFIVVCGDGEYIIYTAIGLRNKSFGSGLEFVWSNDKSNSYGVRESSSKIKIFQNFKETKIIRPSFTAEGVFGGTLLAVRSTSFVTFYDWEGRVVRKIDVVPKAIYWSDSGDVVTIATEASFFILRYNKDIAARTLDGGVEVGDEGIEDAFELLSETNERVRTAQWAGDCFVYTNAANRLNYCVGGEIFTIAHLDRQMYLLGYVPGHNRLYLVDKNLNMVCYTLQLSVINYQTAILRQDFEAAEKLLPGIPTEARERVSQFLESQGLKEQALQVSTDTDHRFDLAVQLGHLELAEEIAKEADSEHKWRQLGDLALSQCKWELAEECLLKAGDLNGLLLLYTSIARGEGIEKLAQLAVEQGKNNIAFMCYFQLRRVDACIDLLCNTGRIPEAAFFARTYAPGQVSRVVKLWREDLSKKGLARAAESLADPLEYDNLFPDISLGLRAEEIAQKEREQVFSASRYLEVRESLDRDIVAALKEEGGILEEGVDEEPLAEEQEEEEEVEQQQPEEVVFNEDVDVDLDEEM